MILPAEFQEPTWIHRELVDGSKDRKYVRNIRDDRRYRGGASDGQEQPAPAQSDQSDGEGEEELVVAIHDVDWRIDCASSKGLLICIQL